MSVKKKANGHWSCRFKVNGKSYYRTKDSDFPKGTTKKEAEQLAADYRQEVLDHLERGNSHRIDDCMDRWYRTHVLRNLGYSARKGIYDHDKKYMSYHNCMKDHFKDYTIDDAVLVASNIIDAAYDDGLKHATIRRRVACFKKMVGLAFTEWKILDKNLADEIKLPPPSKPRVIFLGRSEWDKLHQNCRDWRVSDLIKFATMTGLRKGELFSLDQNSFADGFVHLKGIDTKTGEPRKVAVPPEGLAIAKTAFPIPFSYSKVSKDWDATRKLSGLEYLRWHDLRHVFGTWLMRTGKIPVEEIQKTMGHNNIKQTMQYAHFHPDYAKNSAPLMSDILQGKISIEMNGQNVDTATPLSLADKRT